MLKITPKRITLTAVAAVLLAIAIVATAIAASFWDYLMSTFGSSDIGSDSQTLAGALVLGDEFVQECTEDAIVLMKNENDTLPLAENERKINLFGYGSTDKGFVYSGGGSSGTFINMDKANDEDIDRLVITPQEAFEAEGFEVNKELMKFYTDFSTYNATIERGINTLYQPKADAYSADVIRQARAYSGIAVVVISRNGSESVDVPLTQRKNNGANVTDNTRTYLQLTTEEEGMLDIVTDNFDKVIVLLNTAAPIDTGFLEDRGIDAAMYVGIPGQSGTLAIPRLLKGYKTEKVDGADVQVASTPSGRLADTYAYSVRKYAPTDANMYAVPSTFGQVTYAEGIYFGYKWYETADAEGYFDNVTTEYGKGYDGVVQYPFGYGLSYDTDFTYTVKSSLSDNANITADTKIKIEVIVKNGETATATGKDVVQLYYTPPYYDGEIEKSEVNLLAFAKTKPLAPGQEQTVEFEITPYDMACYDDYGRNPGSHKGYELDRGDYTISLRTDAHTLADCENSELTYKVAETIDIDKDPVTGEDVVNRFTGEDAYLGLPIDGSTAGGDAITYLSRADFEGTYPKKRTADRSNKKLLDEVNTKQNDRYDTDVMPVMGQDNGLRLVVKADGTKASLADLNGGGAELKYNDELIIALGKDYEDPKWATLLDQLSADDMVSLVANAFYGTRALESVGKPRRLEIDGPAGFHAPDISQSDRGKLVAFPAETLIGCTWSQETAYNMGRAQGVIGSALNINGWYGPGLNLHRNPFSGRYFEYYSEDPIVIGKIAAEVIRGAANTGLYCYMKHFAVSEEGVNPENVYTWLTEQTMREIYLKPFEIAVKEGGANGIMTSFNCIGAVWAGACDPMNNDILRGEWGFRGSLITDWSLGRPYMNGMQGIRAGNDLMMDLDEPFDRSATTLTLLRTASKNALYTFANTYARAKDYQENGDADDRYSVELKMSVTQAPFSPIPIVMVVSIWVLAAAGIAVCVIFIVKKPEEKDE